MKNTLLQFDFHEKEKQAPVVFTDPLYMITTTKLDEIDHCFKQIEQAIQDGHYVAGYFNYEVAYSFYDVDFTHRDESMPLLSLGVFSAPVDQSIQSSDDYTVSNWKMKETKESYIKNFHHIMEAIHSNRTKQVNYTVPFEAKFSGNSYRYYEDLKNAQKSSFSAYLQFDHFDIVSVSPELFFHYKEEEITVRPMKGTIKRGKTADEDKRHYQYLQSSRKDRHENELITALMKEELTQVAVEESIRVTDAYTIEQYPTVYQMTSTIKGQVKPSMNMLEVFKYLFPCGSISGTPKHETLQLIAELEPYERGVYCGAVGYFSPHKEAIFNVPIRTVTIDRQSGLATYGAGGAITEKSNAEDEYEEIWTKTNVLTYREPIFQLIETIGLKDGQWIVLNEHIERLKASASYFNFQLSLKHLQAILDKYAAKYNKGHYRLRCLFHADGKLEDEIFPVLQPTSDRIRLAPTNIQSNDTFLYHKTTNREIYESFHTEQFFDTLLWNERGEITEFTIGNVVVSWDGELYTPPVSSGLLDGTFRRNLIQNGQIKERIILKDDLQYVDDIWFINSVRKWIKVTLSNK